MSFPSFNLLAQSILSGVFIGGLYGLIGLGLGLTWGLLRQINLAHFGLVFLAAYMSYHMATVWGFDPLITLLVCPRYFSCLAWACSGCSRVLRSRRLIHCWSHSALRW